MSDTTTKEDITGLIRPEDIATWWDCMFRHADQVATPDTMIEVRKIGMRNGELFQESLPCQPWLGVEPVSFITGRVEQAAKAGVGVFMAPALLKDRRATDESVTHLVGVTVDLDTGDTMSKLQKLVDMGLKPTLVVASGGITEEGNPKIHVHYRLSEPCDEPWKVAHVREAIARQIGGDSAFKRIPQVVRIPGSVHEKDPSNPKLVAVVISDPDIEYDLTKFEDVLGLDFNNVPDWSMWSDAKQGVAGAFKDPEKQHDRFVEISSTVIHAGGNDADSRFRRFSEYTGHMIQLARVGKMSVKEAYDSVEVWNQERMSPPWPAQRVIQEFGALLERDKKNNPDAWAALEPKQVETASAQTLEEWTVRKFIARKQFIGAPPPVAYIVDNFLIENEVHALVADGGVGKTYMALDLAIRCAIGEGDSFLGFKVMRKAAVIMLTVEDTKDDIHRRIYNIDRSGDLLTRTEDRLYVIPVRQEIRGGLTLVEKDQRGNHKPSKAWEFLVEKFKTVKEDHPGMPVVVIIDTYSATHHGDENTSIGTNEWFRAAGLLSDLNAAVLVTHHIRKTDPDQEIKTVSDFRGLVRGSSAFINNCRAVFGVWEMPNQKQLKKESGAEDEAVLYNFGMIKANGSMDWSGRSNPKYPEPIITLRRRGDGALIYDALIHSSRLSIGAKVKARHEAAAIQLLAAVHKAVELYADASVPLTGKNLTRELKEYLPPEVHDVVNARQLIEDGLADAVRQRKLVRVPVKVRGKTIDIYDVPTGRYALHELSEKAEFSTYINWENYVYDQEAKAYILKK